MKNRIMVGLTAVAIATTALAGCSNSSTTGGSTSSTKAGSSAGAKVAFIPKLTGVGYFEAGGAGAVDAGKKLNLDVRYLGSPEASVANQTNLINTYTSQGYKSLIIASTSPDGLCNALKKAKTKGSVILTWDSDTNPECRQFYISQGTPTQLGELLVKMASDSLPKDQAAEVAFHYSSPTVTDQNQWVNVAKTKIGSDTKWKIVDAVYSNNQADLAVQKAEALINAHPNLKAIICPDATALPATAKALENLKRKDIVVVGFSTPNAMKTYVKSGTVKEFALWDVKKQGALAVAVADKLIKGDKVEVGSKISVEGLGDVEVQNNSAQGYPASADKPDSGVIVLPERVVFTKDNIDQYDF